MSSTTVLAPTPCNFYVSGLYEPDRAALNASLSTSAPGAPSPRGESRPKRINMKNFQKPFVRKASSSSGGPFAPKAQPGGFFGLPDLQLRSTTNKKKSKRHFHKGRRHTPAPGSAPRAPHNSNSYLLLTGGLRSNSPGLRNVPFHVVTPNPFAPGTAWSNGYGTLDKDAAELGALAGIDMYGSNAGLITRTAAATAQPADHASCMDDDDAYGGAGGDSSPHGASEPEDTLGFELHDAFDEDDDDSGGSGPAAAAAAAAGLRARLAEQAAYVAELEEHNLNLQEKVFLLQRQLSDAEGALQQQRRPHGDAQEPRQQPQHRRSSSGDSLGGGATTVVPMTDGKEATCFTSMSAGGTAGGAGGPADAGGLDTDRRLSDRKEGREAGDSACDVGAGQGSAGGSTSGDGLHEPPQRLAGLGVLTSQEAGMLGQ